MTVSKPKAPSHLSAESAAWWRDVRAAYALESHHIRLLTLAAEALDRGEDARRALAELGTVYVDRFGAPRTRPEVAIERDSRLAFKALVGALGLDAEVASNPAWGGR